MFIEKIKKAIRNPRAAFRWAYSHAEGLFKIFNLKASLFFCSAKVTLGKKLVPQQSIRFLGKGRITIGDRCNFGVRNGGFGTLVVNFRLGIQIQN